MTIYLTDPANITGSVVAWTVAGYVAVFLFALALAAWLRRKDRRGRRPNTTIKLIKPLSRDDALELAEAIARARDRLGE